MRAESLKSVSEDAALFNRIIQGANDRLVTYKMRNYGIIKEKTNNKEHPEDIPSANPGEVILLYHATAPTQELEKREVKNKINSGNPFKGILKKQLLRSNAQSL